MHKVTADKFQKDYCKVCIYKDVCCENYKIACYKIPRERKDYLASMLYSKPTHVIESGDSN